MSESSHYRIVLNADEAGTREIMVFPPLSTPLAALLRESLQQRARLTSDNPKGYIMRPAETTHETYGEGTMFTITHLIQTASLKWLGQSAVDFLDSVTGDCPDISHQLELEAEKRATAPIIEKAEVNPEYL
ncbi:MAG TPA: hypothetical protein VLE74_01945 [Candidatus Saccharimonadales bacterium]|nr:hypothetical protein [Candidatus Saccharimonadales bacterium]